MIAAGPFSLAGGTRNVLTAVDPETGEVLFLDTARDIAGIIPCDYDPEDPDADIHPWALYKDMGLRLWARERVEAAYVRGSWYVAAPVHATVRGAGPLQPPPCYVGAT